MFQPSEEIKTKLDIVDVIRDYIPLKAAGLNFKAKCPFHREKSASFMVSPEKKIWHCFGCGKGGDIFSFIMEMEGLSFAEALRLLAPKAGVVLKKYNPEATSARNRLLDIMEAAVNYYHDILLDDPRAEAARDYLAKRKLTPATIKEWQIGHALEDWDDSLNYLRGRGFKENEIFLAGLSIKKEGTNRFYNRFRDRIMFPIFDINGEPIAFSGRINPAKEDNEKTGKYINSPATQVYNKSAVLFGLHKAKMEIKIANSAVLVEGQMDVITAHQHGFKNVIASSGTALTAEQIKMIKRYTDNILLAFDMDQAGQAAAERGIKEAMRAEMNIKVITLESGKDPDECIKNNPEEWAAAVANAEPMMEYYFNKVAKELDVEKPEGKKEAARRLLAVIINFGSGIERDHWLKKMAQKFDINENALREAISKVKDNNYEDSSGTQEKNNIPQAPVSPRAGREETASENLLALAIKFPSLAAYIADSINIDYIFGLGNKFIYKNLIIYYNNIKQGVEAQNFDYQNFKLWLAEKSPEEDYWPIEDGWAKNSVLFLDRLALLADRDFYNFDLEQAKSEATKIVVFLKKRYLFQRMKEIEKMIGTAEEKEEDEEMDNLMRELKSLSDEMRKLG